MTINTHQWNVISQAVSGQRQADRVQQQSIYRIIEALDRGDDAMLNALLERGAPFDAPLALVGPDAVPMPPDLAPSDYPFSHISPMAWAAWRNDVEAMERLFRRGADPLFPGPDGRDPAWMALWSNALQAWDWLKDKSPVWGARTTDGKRTTRLIDAVRRRNLLAVQDIITHVDVSAYDNTGRNALHYNFLQTPYTDVDLNIARLLVAHGAPTQDEDHEGVSPAALANTPEQQALMERAMLERITSEAQARAQAQRDQLEATSPTPKPEDPTDPNLPQIQRPVKFKKLM